MSQEITYIPTGNIVKKQIPTGESEGAHVRVRGHICEIQRVRILQVRAHMRVRIHATESAHMGEWGCRCKSERACMPHCRRTHVRAPA